MFILYAIVVGLILGSIGGGRIERLASLSFRAPWLAIGGLAAQVVLFAGPVAEGIGALGPPLYVASMLAVVAFLLLNVRIAGVPVMALGAASNLVAILANGGTMPASGEAIASAGVEVAAGFTNSREVAAPVLAPLGDVLALPDWIPFANVFSLGDVLLGIGAAVVVFAAMRRDATTVRTAAGTGDAGIDAGAGVIPASGVGAVAGAGAAGQLPREG